LQHLDRQSRIRGIRSRWFARRILCAKHGPSHLARCRTETGWPRDQEPVARGHGESWNQEPVDPYYSEPSEESAVCCYRLRTRERPKPEAKSQEPTSMALRAYALRNTSCSAPPSGRSTPSIRAPSSDQRDTPYTRRTP